MFSLDPLYIFTKQTREWNQASDLNKKGEINLFLNDKLFLKGATGKIDFVFLYVVLEL